MKDKKNFGSFIKEKRQSKNYSQKELADLLYVTESAVSKWERGISYPDITLISDICKVLDISEKELIQSSEDHEYRKIKKDSDKYNKIKKTVFWSFNITYLVAILTCFIVNLAVSHTLSWFFIVLTSILVAYCFVPTFTWTYNKFKLPIFIGSSFISLFVLFLTCSIYSNNYWFMIPTIGVLIVYFIIFFPILFNKQKDYLNKEKYNNLSRWFSFIYIASLLILVLLLLVTIYGYKTFNLLLAITIAISCFIIPLIFSVILLFEKGKKHIKIVIFSLVGVFVILFAIGTCFSLHLKSTETTQTYTITQSYNDIELKADNYDINFYLSSSGENFIVCSENAKNHIEVKVISDVLYISQIDNRMFYEKLFNFNSFKLDLYLSKQTIDSLKINSSTGNIDITKDFTFNTVDIDHSTGNVYFKAYVKNEFILTTSTGNIEISNCDISPNATIQTSTGNVKLTNVTCGKLNISLSTGNTILTNVIASDDFTFDGSTGDLTFDGFDAKNMYISLSTGDVEGTILTSKFFVAKSSTGNVSVPDTREGGRCEINTSTGDIEITYKE